jgi:predicted ester cyclase
MAELDKIQIAERNKANYLKAKDLFNQNKVAECVLHYSINHEIKSKQGEKGRANILAFLEGMHQTWLDIQITVEHVVAEDNWVMGRSVATATHSKVVLGVPPTNKQIVTAFWDLHKFDENGLIVETWNLMDSIAIMQQIGLMKG